MAVVLRLFALMISWPSATTAVKGERMRKLLIATNNQGKVREYAEMLAGLSVKLTWPRQEGLCLEVEETGETYEANARIKALAYARATGLPSLADDSGLDVDALDGAPGVRSARYAGPDASDEDRYRLLLENLRDVPDARRTARFRCVVALAMPGGDESIVRAVAQGACEGTIAHGPRGDEGFGYDPVFFVAEFGRTMAELAPEVKNSISHRARALEALRPELTRLLLDTAEDA
jgi:XTP/dITP diphosphohydrolase